MALIDQLKVQRETVEAELAGYHADVRQLGQTIEQLERQRWDLDTAIAALSPPPADPDPYGDKEAAREMLEREEVEIPEGFTKWEGCEWTGLPSDMVQVIFHDEPTPYFPTSAGNLEPLWAWDRCSPDAQRIIAYRIIEAEPVDIEMTGANSPQDYSHETIFGQIGVASSPLSDFEPIPGVGEESRDQSDDVDGSFDAPAGETHFDEAEEASARERNLYLNPPVTTPENKHLAEDDGSDDPLFDAMAAKNDFGPTGNESVSDRNKFSPFGIFRRETEDA